MTLVSFFFQDIKFLRVKPDLIFVFNCQVVCVWPFLKMSGKLPYFAPKSGFAVCYNNHLTVCRDRNEAMKRARGEWESLPQEEKDAINKRVKSEWAQSHPPAVPKEVDPEEKKWLLFFTSF